MEDFKLALQRTILETVETFGTFRHAWRLSACAVPDCEVCEVCEARSTSFGTGWPIAQQLTAAAWQSLFCKRCADDF